MRHPSKKNTVVGKIFTPQTIEAVNYLARVAHDYLPETHRGRGPTRATPLPWAIHQVLRALRRSRYRLESRRSKKYDLPYLRKLGVDHANDLADRLDRDPEPEPEPTTLASETSLIEDSIEMHQCWNTNSRYGADIPEKISQKRLNEFRRGFRDTFRSRGYGYLGEAAAEPTGDRDLANADIKAQDGP